MLSPKDERIVSLLASKIRQRFPDAKITVFGSRARGTTTEESDLDVCIVVNELDDATDGAIMDIAWQVGFDNNVVISTITYSREEIEKGPCAESSLIRSILKHGVAV